jgi:hypothetical protein
MVFFTKMNGYQKMCDTNKNVTRMGMIIKRVYCIICIKMNQQYNSTILLIIYNVLFNIL